MCGRYTLSAAPEVLLDALELEPPAPEWKPSFNIAPTTNAPVVLSESPKKLTLARFGLIPFWAKDPRTGARLINARSETVSTKPAFRRSFQRKRCLVVADGYYEWEKLPGKKRKVPHHFRRDDSAPITFAGLWDRWRPPEDTGGEKGSERLTSFSILTAPAIEAVEPIHDRMPLIVPLRLRAEWLGEQPPEIEALLRARGERLVVYPVDVRVGSVREDEPDLVVPQEEPEPIL